MYPCTLVFPNGNKYFLKNGGELMGKITLVPRDISGIEGGVETITECVTSVFEVNSDGEPVKTKGCPEVHKCKMLASMSNGTVSLSVKGVGIMISVRLEDISALVCAAECAAEICH